MRLAAVMDLMLEEMQQQAVGAFGLYVILTMDPNGAIRSALVERIAPLNQAAIDRRLRRAQLSKRRTRDGPDRLGALSG